MDLQKYQTKLLEYLSDVIPSIETSLDEGIVVRVLILILLFVFWYS